VSLLSKETGKVALRSGCGKVVASVIFGNVVALRAREGESARDLPHFSGRDFTYIANTRGTIHRSTVQQMMSDTEKKKKKEKPASAYEAFSSVDELVAKPVLGSDGAAAWQDFRKNVRRPPSSSSVAPTAPLKQADRAAGFASWQQEREHESAVREDAGEASLHAGYTEFERKHRGDEEGPLSAKERKRIERRRRPEDSEYFLPAPAWAGWKWDYVFTTRDRGTGYYWDGTDSLKKLRGELTGEPPAEAAKRSKRPAAEDEGEPKQKKKKKKKRAPVIVDDPNNPLEQVAAVLQQRRELQAQLPPGWEAAQDSVTKKTYYYNRQTGERTWEAPLPEEPLPEGWQSAKDASTGKEYYYNAATGETRWERPTSQR
jgi:hypothetical protein